MKLKKWFPWRFFLRRTARRYGFLDPVALLARLRNFGQPSEIQEPMELLRAGVLFHARGVINTRAIQYNLDWVWPFWVVKQFKPEDASFIPRGFAFSHVNLTHRNWTAVGRPDLPIYPVIDPRGLVTPLFDGWSIDVWLLSETGRVLYPSQQPKVGQQLDLSSEMKVTTTVDKNDLWIESTAAMGIDDKKGPFLKLKATGKIASEKGWIIISIRPYNPEGISFIDHMAYDKSESRLYINHNQSIVFGAVPEKVLFSSYENGDISFDLERPETEQEISCPIGMATAAAFYPVRAGKPADIDLKVPLTLENSDLPATSSNPESISVFSETAALEIPDAKFRFLYDAAVRTVLLLTADDVFPGPYTYRRFWFRDACFIINALLGLGLAKRSLRLIQKFPDRQTMTGYFLSQEGEWDSNGQVLWLAHRFHDLTGQGFDRDLLAAFMKGARWIIKNRRHKKDRERHEGLLPAGFSAEHLGPNDYYYWDNFWGLAGLRSAARLADKFGLKKDHNTFTLHADAFESSIFSSISGSPGYRRFRAVPASPYRRMDAGAVGSLVADYPLGLTPPGDDRIMNTLYYLYDHCFYGDAFFQDMIHSGINVYLTLGIAQTLLRAGSKRFDRLVRTVADLASPTGQWPEAINPLTGGGCMGDGQHGWAAAEWIMMMRNLFIREEGQTLIIGSGIFPEWIEKDEELSFGPTLVPGGKLKVRFLKSKDQLTVYLDSDPDLRPVPCKIRVPGYTSAAVDTTSKQCRLAPLS